MSTVVLIRAGCTDYDDQHRVLGTLDMPVNERGVEQIRCINRRLQERGLRLQAILTSPDDPACGTAHAIAETQAGAKVRELEELRNVNQGLWQGLPESDIRKRFPRLFRSGKEDVTAICPPEGETLSDACQRLERVLSKNIRKYDVLAIVAPEPLATVIRCTLQHRRPHVTACLCGEENAESMYVFESSGFEASDFLNADDPTAEEAQTVAVSEEVNR
ncbi:MAG: histidine phosphatase family protein [Planctomycetota bacterium]